MEGKQPNSDAWAFMHDAELLHITIDWAANTASFRFRPTGEGGQQVLFRAEECRTIILPRVEPWGKGGAADVNSVQQSLTQGMTRLEIEMQSGDVIVLEAKRVAVER